MKILLDECVPAPMQSLLGNHACTTVQDEGWSGIRNGDLLQRAEAEFDLFITSDQNIRYQQNLAGRSIAILELSTNDIGRIRAAASLLQDALEKIQPNGFQHLNIP
jgi:predicted nuclease of predicted toxin-antitoxin system